MSKINTNFRKFIKDVLELMRKPVMSVLPGQLSFFLLLSLIPMMLIIGLVAPLLSVPLESIVDLINSGFPADTSSLIIPLLEEKTLNYSTIFLIISALLLVSKGTRSIMSVASIIYGVEDKKNIIYINIKIIYTISPNKRINPKSVNKGAIFTTVLWTILTSIYSFYISNISSYNVYYGSASKLIVLMLWIYLISYIFVLGMSINANITRQE